MFPFPIARPQGCDIQIFNRSPAGSGSRGTRTWNKPRGVSHIYMLLIGAGGGGRLSGGGGGSGGVTVWYGATQHVPDVLTVIVGVGGSAANGGDSLVKLMTNQALLSANGGSAAGGSGAAGAGATVSTATNFSAMGFFQAVAGQAGSAIGGAATTSTTTFLSGGSGGASTTNAVGYDNTANYGYVAKGGIAAVGSSGSGGDASSGTFQMQPIIFGLGGGGGGSSGNVAGNGGSGGKGGIGSGGGGAGTYLDSASDSIGGDGLVLIASW